MALPMPSFFAPAPGFPVTCLARLRPALEAETQSLGVERATKDGKRVLLSSEARDAFDFDHVFGTESTNANIFYQGEMERWIRTVTQGYNCSFIVAGETSSGKSTSLIGSLESQDGLLPRSVRLLFEQLRAKVKAGDANAAKAARSPVSRTPVPSSSFSISAQSCEIFNDEIHDLLDPLKMDLRVDCTEFGNRVINLSQTTLLDESDFTKIFTQSVRNRSTLRTNFGPVSSRSSFFFFLDITQCVGPRFDRLCSRVVFASLPGLEKLADDPTQLLVREGVSFNRDVLAFNALLQTLSDPASADFPNHAASLSTRLLDDALGGNSVTLCLATVGAGCTPTARAALQCVQRLRMVRNHPVMNDDHAMGLARVQRMRVLHMFAERAQTDAAAEKRIEFDTAALRAQHDQALRQLESTEDERARLQEERDRYFAMYNEFRNRFASTVSARATVQSQLLQSEQERLAISQRLLETQIEVVAAREEAAANRCALDLRSLESDRELTSVLAQELQHHALEEHKQVTAQLHEAERQVDEMKARVSAATEEVQRVRASAAEQVRIAHSEVSALVERARAHAEKDSVLTERVAALEKELIGARTTAAEAVEQRLSAVTLCDEAQRKLHELEVDCAVLVATIEAAKTAAEDGEAQRHSLKQEKLDLREEANQTRQALASTEARLRLALDEVSSLSARLAIATDTISKLQDSQNENSQARVDSLAEIRALTKQLSAVEADKQHATVELQSIQAAYSKLQAQHAIATQKLGQFSAVLTATRTTAFDSWQAKRDTTSPLPVVHDEEALPQLSPPPRDPLPREIQELMDTTPLKGSALFATDAPPLVKKVLPPLDSGVRTRALLASASVDDFEQTMMLPVAPALPVAVEIKPPTVPQAAWATSPLARQQTAQSDDPTDNRRILPPAPKPNSSSAAMAAAMVLPSSRAPTPTLTLTSLDLNPDSAAPTSATSATSASSATRQGITSAVSHASPRVKTPLASARLPPLTSLSGPSPRLNLQSLQNTGFKDDADLTSRPMLTLRESTPRTLGASIVLSRDIEDI